MRNKIKFVVRKDKEEVITYMEYEKRKGFDVKPKQNINIEDMINVDKMVIINPTLIEKLIEKKCKKKFEKIFLLLQLMQEEDEGDNTSADIVLDEIYRLKNLTINKYKHFLEKEKYKLLLKKIEIIEKEAQLRKRIIIQESLIESSRKSKPKR